MKQDKYKILLLGDYSGCHAMLGEGLKALGHDVVTASSGSLFQNTPRDYDLRRRGPGKIGGFNLFRLASKLVEKTFVDFDIVALNNPQCFDLRPDRNQILLEKIMARNNSVFLTAMGTDYFHIRECLNVESKIKYNEWRTGDRPSPLALERPDELAAWQTDLMRDYCRWVYDNIDGATAVLYEYFVSLSSALSQDRISYCGIPVKTDEFQPVKLPRPGEKVNIMLGRHSKRKVEKGTDLLEFAVNKALARIKPDYIDFTIVEDVSAEKYKAFQSRAHLLLDQIYSYTPATNALWAMCRGQGVVSGGEEDYYGFIGETELRPVFNAPPEAEMLDEAIYRLIYNPYEFFSRAASGYEFVKKHNDYISVAKRCIDFWSKRLNG